MPRIASESKHLFTFVKGLITEGTGVTSPENSMVDGDNVDIGISGICRRRNGLDLEESYNLSTPTLTVSEVESSAITVHEWKSVDGDGSINLWVMQVGTTLYIGYMGVAALSDGYMGSINLKGLYSNYYSYAGLEKLKPFIINGEKAKFNPMDSSFGKGKMFLTSKYTEPFYLEYESENNRMRLRMILMRERDFEGVDDGYNVDEQPDELIGTHAYNLMNQGWDFLSKTTVDQQNEEGITTVIDQPTVGETTFPMLPIF